MAPPFTLGVEEEYQLVDCTSLALRPRAERVLPPAVRRLGRSVTGELNLSQVEVATTVCDTLAEVRAELVRLRQAVAGAAAEVDTAIVATGTHPFTDWLGQSIAPGERYEGLERDYQQLAREQLVCGCHVHVGIDDAELAIEVINRTRPWLAVVLALGANSPFWEGIDTGYASYRAELYGRWPMTGTPHPFRSRAEYEEVVEALVRTGSISDASFLYWDARPSTRFPTVEFRVADVCATVDEAVMVAGLCRSLARVAAAEAAAGVAVDHHRPELVSAARWRAARYGVDGELVDVVACAARPAPDVVGHLLDHLRADLEDHGEWDELAALVGRALAQGNGARRQRAVFDKTGDLAEVVRALAEETVRG